MSVRRDGTSTAYERYLRTDELLSLQRDTEGRVDPDEMIFIVVQQSSELWLKLIAYEMESAVSATRSDAVLSAVRHLRRVHSYLVNLMGQLDALDHIPPWSYQRIRTQLEDGSGFSSPGWSNTRRLARSLGEEFTAFMARRAVGLHEVYTRHTEFEDLYQLAESLVDVDSDCMLWRTRHLKVVERMVGVDAVGVAGTPIHVLAKLSTERLYPELWRIRSQLTSEASEYFATAPTPAP
ncbi:tryptophan 2,3-dioxygenase family protein [Streptomyces sp. NPDC058683]|uniref:tryptophan 2,3-dioxygenase family protein n=1 Tax=Streptomyces sp. NPDC058683 TaxID=3346597 RepID=UPI00365244DF